MSRNLSDCSTELCPLVEQLLVRLVDDKIGVMIISVLRTMEEHKANLARGVSSAVLSFHLPRYMRVPGLPITHPDYNRSDAVDLAVLSNTGRIDWDTNNPGWMAIGHHAEALGLEWGGRWKKPFDPGHVQLPRSYWSSRG